MGDGAIVARAGLEAEQARGRALVVSAADDLFPHSGRWEHTMQAAVLTGTQTLQVREAPKPEISDGEVLLRSRAVSICGTDMRIYRSGHTKLPANTPRILGHEMAGEVVQVGQGVTGVKPGDRVAVAPNFGCGVCRMCQRGWFHLCPDYGAIGLTEGSSSSAVATSSAMDGPWQS